MIKLIIQGEHANYPQQDGWYRIDPLTSSVTLIRHAGKNILVDTGSFRFGEKLVAALKEEGLTPADIDYVFITHHHLDHIANLHLFWPVEVHAPKSRLRPDGVCDIFHDYSLRPLPEGIEIMLTPGHTPDHIVVVYRDNGLTYVVAGDAIREDIIREETRSSALNSVQFIESAKKILDLADVVIPGHGPIIEGEKLAELKQLLAEKL